MASARTRAQARLGYLPEHAPAPGELTVREHLRTRARLKGCDDEAVARAM
jgi:ABC-type multidrug transport system ATPase subunit